MPDQKLTDVPYIGEQTADKLRKKLRGNRPTSRAGEPVSVQDATKFGTRAKNVLDARQQRKLAEASDTFDFKPTREARQQQADREQAGQTQQSDTITRGDFRVGRDDLEAARDTFEELPDDEQSDDRSSREPVTTDREQWSNNVDKFDYPGVDTPNRRRPRQNTVDTLFTSISGQRRPRESWRDSEPERTDAQRRLGEQPDTADAERTGVLRDSDDGEFVERPLRSTDDGLVSANGRAVSPTVQDPTIGRDPDDGEFENRPLGREPSIDAPDFVGMAGGGGGGDAEMTDPYDMSDGGGALSLDNSDRDTIRQLERSSVAAGREPEVLEQMRFSDEPTPEQQETFTSVAGSLLSERDAIEDPSRTDTQFFDSDTLDDVRDLKNRIK